MKKILILIFSTLIISCSFNKKNPEPTIFSNTEYIQDESRDRIIPVEIYLSEISNNKIVLINAGYGCSATEYSYIAKHLVQIGFLVVRIQHELQTDDFLPSGENMYEARLPNWKEGIKNIQSTLEYLKIKYPNHDYEKLNLIGHSNGGDIAMLFGREYPNILNSIITLDHRRMPISKTNKYKILSIRADQFPADNGVIPENLELDKSLIKIVKLENVAHDYLRDNATKETKKIVLEEISKILK